jgi:hypothetical protein
VITGWEWLLVVVLVLAIVSSQAQPRPAFAGPPARSVLVELAGRFCKAEKQREGPPARLRDFYGTLFRQQVEVLHCQARKIAVLCTRRAGKTTLVPKALFQAAENNPGCIVYFIGRTRLRAKQLAWKALEAANEEYRLGYLPNATELTLTHPTNGAEIRLFGANDKLAPEKIRGDKVAYVIIDEAQSIPEDVLETLVDDVFWPALLDVSGQLVLMGTPGYVCAGFWYSLTRNEDEKSCAERAAGWAVFEWGGLDNPSLNHKGERICDLFRAELAALEADPAKGASHPVVLREYKGRWCTDTDGLFFSFALERNLYDVLPAGHLWQKAMGVDLGSTFAISVLAYSDTHPIIYEVWSMKLRGSTPSLWFAETQKAFEEHQPAIAVVDTGGLGSPIVEEWQEDIPVEPAEKQKRDSFVALFNADMEKGRFKARRGSPLSGELSTLPKDPNVPPGKPPQPKEGYDDHCADGTLYAWRKARELAGKEDKPALPLNTVEAGQVKNRASMEKAIRKAQERREWD